MCLRCLPIGPHRRNAIGRDSLGDACILGSVDSLVTAVAGVFFWLRPEGARVPGSSAKKSATDLPFFVSGIAGTTAAFSSCGSPVGHETRCSFCDENKLSASADDETTEDPLDFFVFLFFSTDDRTYEIVCVAANHTQSIYSPLNLYQNPQQRLPELLN